MITKTTEEFCIFVLYLATRLNFIINSRTSVNYYRFPTYVNDVLVFFFIITFFKLLVICNSYNIFLLIIILSLIEISLNLYHCVVQLIQIL